VDFEFVWYQRRDGDVNQVVEFELACLPASLQAVSQYHDALQKNA
jgi:hypothetical protein